MAAKPTSRPSSNVFRSSLKEIHNCLPAEPRIAILGIGNELRGDDAAGLEVLRILQTALAAQDCLLLLKAGIAPENFTGVLRRFAPHLVILVDAADLALPPGEYCCLDWRETVGASFATHAISLEMFSRYLEIELACQVILVGIQASNLAFDSGLSHQVSQAVINAAQDICAVISNTCDKGFHTGYPRQPAWSSPLDP